VPWKVVEKLFFNKGLISGLILLGQGEKPKKNEQKNAPQDFLPQ